LNCNVDYFAPLPMVALAILEIEQSQTRILISESKNSLTLACL
jgi:hypothetical protein